MNKRLPLLLFFVFSIFYSLQADVVYATPLQADEMPIGNMLKWTTSLEDNVQHFAIEKSSDGLHFQNIGTQAATGQLNKDKDYKFLDTGIGIIKSYYRLKVIENDGTSSYSKVVLVQKEAPNRFAILSYNSELTNPIINFTLDAVTEGQMAFAVYQFTSQELVLEKFLEIQEGVNELELNLQELPADTYQIRLTLDDEMEIFTIEKSIDSKEPVVSNQKVKKEK